jgi:hypothetical protein
MQKKFKSMFFITLLIVGIISIIILNRTGIAIAQNTGTKICSVFIPGNWRDSINVPQGWTPGMCINFMRSVGATHYHLGCAFYSGFTWGEPNGGSPNNNCGW